MDNRNTDKKTEKDNSTKKNERVEFGSEHETDSKNKPER